MESDIIPVDPVIHVIGPALIESSGIQIFNGLCLKGIRCREDLFFGIGRLVEVVYCEREKVICHSARFQCLFRKHSCAHCFKAVNACAGLCSGSACYRESRVVESSAFADEIFCDRAEGYRLIAFAFSCEETVDDLISSVSSLVESEGGIVCYAVFGNGHAVEHGSNVSVVSDVVSRTSVDGCCGCRCESNGRSAVIGNSDPCKFDSV